MALLDDTDVINALIKKYIKSHVNTILPAKIINVKSFNDHQTVDVLPLIGDTFADNVKIELPQILGVPLVFPSAGGGSLSFPVQEGDTVAILVSQRGITEWKISDGEQNVYTPSDKRSFDRTDAIAIPGLYTTQSNLSPSTTDVELKFANSFVRMKPNGDVDVSASGNISLTSAQDVNITAVGDVNISGTNINLN